MAAKIWSIAQGDPEAERSIGAELGLEPLLCRLLANRGALTPEAADEYINPRLASLSDPFEIPFMGSAAERIALAKERHEKVAVYGDYDVDGLTAAASLKKFLAECGVNAVSMTPDRNSGRRGLKPEEIERLHGQGASLAVTVDTGASCFDAARRAGELGLDLIITDHHEPSGEKPQAHAVVNTHYCPAGSPCADLSGAGLAFKLMMAARKKIFGGSPSGKQPNLKRLLSLVALGTVADCVSIRKENRIMVRHGLDELSSRSLVPGLAALKAISKINGRQVTARDISFDLAPRIASASRMNNAKAAMDLLGSMDASQASGLAVVLDSLNAKRKKIQEEILAEARAMAQATPEEEKNLALVLGGDGWEPGVIGITASRLVDEYNVPVVIVSFAGESGKGSCRSIQGFDVHSALEETAGLIDGFGGHAGAAGLYVSRANFGAFKKMFLAHAREKIDCAPLIPKVYVDMEMDPSQVTVETARRLSLLEPFGEGSPPPSFSWNGLFISAPPDFIGEDRQSVSLSFKVDGRPAKAIAFKMAWFFKGFDWKRSPVDIVYAPEINYWADAERLRLRIVDIRTSRR